MKQQQVENLGLLDKLVFGRVTPHIYAFQTGTIPNYLKVGDTYRPVSIRLKEWKRRFPDLKKEYEHEATVTDDVYFRDHAVHYYLEAALGKERLQPEQLPAGAVYYSREFFKEVHPSLLDDAIQDIRDQYTAKSPIYSYYDANQRLAVTMHYERSGEWQLRPNQQEAVNNFVEAVANGRTNLLMYAVMRFGKSFTSLACAKAIQAKTILIVSAKADVREEWKKNVERPGNFAGYQFLSSQDLMANDTAISDIHGRGETAVIFLTLQDLQGDRIKDKHAQVFEQRIDLLIVDETHFGARAASYGQILRTARPAEEKAIKQDLKLRNKQEDDRVDLDVATSQLKQLNATIRLHLSGTPYRILMGSEFEPEDIVSFVQFTDIANAQREWDEENLDQDDVEEWDNPYFGFPQMIRFAFHPSQAAIEKMRELERNGISLAFSALLKPRSVKKDKKSQLHQQFEHENEILDLLRIIDGSATDSKLLGFLDYEKIKQGQMCRHLVMVLPYCASCDAMENLITTHKSEFKNLSEYEILNISGVDAARVFRTPTDIKTRIMQLEAQGRKTLTLTVNRMLTGSTVEPWDTMLYLKDTASPQEYDQAIFRLQNQYVRELSDGEETIKECLKPQTLLVDFDPHRLFTMQEQKSLIYNANTEKNGNARLQERIADELRISPVITMNHNKLERVRATDILRAVSQYNNTRSITDEVVDLPVDLSILEDEDLRRVIEAQNPFGSRGGLTIEAHTGDSDGTDLDTPEGADPDNGREKSEPSDSNSASSNDDKSIKELENKIRTYYQRILFFSFLCSEPVRSLDDILEVFDKSQNVRLGRNLGLTKRDAGALRNALNAFQLNAFDYKIQNISTLATDVTLEPLERATTSLAKFSRMSASEIITPSNIADEMVALLPEDQLRTSIENGDKILDIASKAGEYTVALAKRLQSLGFTVEQIRDSIYAIPTSSVAYEFTRRFYEILGLNTDCIAQYFNSYDLLEVQTESGAVDYERIKRILTQKKDFAEINLTDTPRGGEDVKFGAVVGNPPYQTENSERNRDDSIFHYFYDIGFALGHQCVLITPARFLQNAGSTPKRWNQKVLNSKHFRVEKFFANSKWAFDDIDIKGGIAICSYSSAFSFDSINIFIPFKELRGIYAKVIDREGKGFPSFERETYVQTKFNLDNLYRDHPGLKSKLGSNGRERRVTSSVFASLDEVFHDERLSDDDVKIYGRRNNSRMYRYANKKYIDPQANFDDYKIMVPAANGSGAIGEVSSTPIIGEPVIGYPRIGYSQTFISLGRFNDPYEAEACLKYIKGKFARALLGIMKTTQNNKDPKVWSCIPIQDFTQASDIKWDCSIKEIDDQLYKKYGLSNDEIAFIEANIQPMD